MIQIQSPTRVDLAGGTLDLWPLHLFVGDCVTVNLAIDVMTGCELEVRNNSKIEVHISDLNFKKEFPSLSEFLKSKQQELILTQKVIQYFQPGFGFRLKTFSESPVGGGLGGSSSLCVSLIRAFLKALNKELSPLEIVELAHNIEAQAIHAPTGTQDYIPALISGLNIIHYSSSGIKIESLKENLKILHSHLMLVYTGRSHNSGINNWQVLKEVIEGDQKPLNALKEVASISSRVAQVCRQGLWSSLPRLFDEEYNARVQLCEAFSSPEIQSLKQLVLQGGASAVKICGAGGGGCVLVWADPVKHTALNELCLKNGFQPIKFQSHFEPVRSHPLSLNL